MCNMLIIWRDFGIDSPSSERRPQYAILSFHNLPRILQIFFTGNLLKQLKMCHINENFNRRGKDDNPLQQTLEAAL